MLEKLRSSSIPSHLNRDDVKKAMQNIITMEVEQRTKAWISQQQSTSHDTSQGQISTALQSQNDQLKTQVAQYQSERDQVDEWKHQSEDSLVNQTEHVMHAVTQVRTPDELQNIYKELIKLKALVSSSFASKPYVPGGMAEPPRKANAQVVGSSGSIQGSGQKRVTFPAVIAQTMNPPANENVVQHSGKKHSAKK